MICSLSLIFAILSVFLTFSAGPNVITRLNVEHQAAADPPGRPPGAPAVPVPETATEALVDLSRQIVNVMRPRLARHPVAASFADYSGSRLDALDEELMNECIDEMYASLGR